MIILTRFSITTCIHYSVVKLYDVGLPLRSQYRTFSTDWHDVTITSLTTATSSDVRSGKDECFK